MDEEKHTMLILIKRKGVVTILISDIADFRAREVTRYKEGHYIMIQGSVLQKT